MWCSLTDSFSNLRNNILTMMTINEVKESYNYTYNYIDHNDKEGSIYNVYKNGQDVQYFIPTDNTYIKITEDN